MYNILKEILSRKPDDITESDLESLYRGSHQIDRLYKSKKMLKLCKQPIKA